MVRSQSVRFRAFAAAAAGTALVAVGGLAGVASGQCDMSVVTQFVPPVVQSGQGYGAAVAAFDGGSFADSLCAVGAPYYDLNSIGGVNGGLVAVYKRVPGSTAWSYEGFVTGFINSTMGYSVAISNDTLVCGAPDYSEVDSGTIGAVFVYGRVFNDSTQTFSWVLRNILTASDAASGDDFGHSVALHPDGTIVVGARNDDNAGGTNAGAAYVFTRSGAGPSTYTWSQFQKLLPSVAVASQAFGFSVGISSIGTRNVIIVGASGETIAGQAGAGAAYVFTRNTLVVGSTYGQTGRLTHPTPAGTDYFGASVSISGTTAIVGAWGDTYSIGAATFTDAGTVQLYTSNFTGGSWVHAEQFTTTDPAANDNFGVKVSLSGDTFLAATSQDDTVGTNRGAAWVFRRIDGVWTQIDKIVPTTENLGSACALSGEVGIIKAGTASADKAAVYRIRRPAFTSQPANRTVGGACAVNFSVVVESPSPSQHEWQWRLDPGSTWQTITNGVNTSGMTELFTASGATGATLTLSRTTRWNNSGGVRCIVTTPCGQATSNEATLTVRRVDTNCSGSTTVQDIYDFLFEWNALAGTRAGGEGSTADFNGVDGVTVQDIYDFLAEWSGRV